MLVRYHRLTSDVNKDRDHAGQDLRIICERYADIREKLRHIKFDGQGNHSNSKGCDLPTLVEIMMLSPSKKAAAIRRLAAVTLCRVLGGDIGLASQILKMNRVQEYLKENEIPHPVRVFGQYVEEQQRSKEVDFSRDHSFSPSVTTAAIWLNSKKIKCLKEATLDWRSDLGALRKEIPAAKATLKALFEIEVAAGALPKNPRTLFQLHRLRGNEEKMMTTFSSLFLRCMLAVETRVSVSLLL
jgi:hypothetical protein